MVIWIILLVMTALAVMAVLWPLSRHYAVSRQADPDTQFYREQIAEIERDRERGVLLPSEAEAAKAEAGRRLLRATGGQGAAYAALGEPALRRRRAVSAFGLSAIPIVALAIYGAYGSPQLPAQPLLARIKSNPEQLDLTAALARIEAHLAEQPDDGRGWEVVAPVYLRSGRLDDAVKAYGNALRLLGEDAARLSSYGEAIITANDGMVPADARQAFDKALQHDPTYAKARYYLARAAEQDGDKETARTHYGVILSSSPSDAPWIPLVKEQLARLDPGSSAAAVASLPAEDRQQAIRGMVEGLANRLATSGGNADEWARLVRSYVVLGERDKASASLKSAREALARDQASLGQLDAVAQELALHAASTQQ